MRRIEPPPLATWILEHGIPGDRDEALAGDLLGDFRSGRSDGWYWRQALAAWFVGWANYLGTRRSLLIFAALWSTLAPAWNAVVDSIEQSPRLLSAAWSDDHPFSVFWLWVVLNLVFIWIGMLLFAAVNSRFASAMNKSELKRALKRVPLIFAPMYFATFVLMNLFAYPGFNIDQSVLTPLGELMDWKGRADALRIPYFLTLLWTMWEATPRWKSASKAPTVWKPVKPPTQFEIPPPNPRPQPTPAAYLDPYTTKRFFVFVVTTGLLNALIAGFLLCRLPDSHTPSIQSLLARAILYVAIGALAGIFGIYLYWNNPASPFRATPPLPCSLFSLACAAGWMWVPAMVIFSEQLSGITALVAGVGAFLLAVGLRHTTSFTLAPTPRAPLPSNPGDCDLFAESLYRPPREFFGYVIAISLYAACWALATGWNYSACVLLALSTSLFAWKRTFARAQGLDADREYKRAALRLALFFIPAVIVTFWALLGGVAYRNYLAGVNAAQPTGDAASAAEDTNKLTDTPPSANGISGYQSIILWPQPEKKQIVPPLPPPTSFLAPGTTKPLVILFDGPYWYFQPPHKAPSPTALQVHGTPLVHDFQSNNFMPLTMEARQTLGSSIPLARCREIQLDLLNSDNHPGSIQLAVLLADSASPNNQLYLGQQPVLTSQAEHFTFKPSPVRETLRFPIPAPAKLRKFDQITIMFFPDESNYDTGPKVAIQQFQLVPR